MSEQGWCLDCGVEIELGDATVLAWRAANAALTRRGDQPLGSHEVARCSACAGVRRPSEAPAPAVVRVPVESSPHWTDEPEEDPSW